MGGLLAPPPPTLATPLRCCGEQVCPIGQGGLCGQEGQTTKANGERGRHARPIKRACGQGAQCPNRVRNGPLAGASGDKGTWQSIHYAGAAQCRGTAAGMASPWGSMWPKQSPVGRRRRPQENQADGGRQAQTKMAIPAADCISVVSMQGPVSKLLGGGG